MKRDMIISLQENTPCNYVIDYEVVSYPHGSGSYNGQSTPFTHSRGKKNEIKFSLGDLRQV